jgi:hypothetical protein
MIIERTESPQWTSNAYLVADREGGGTNRARVRFADDGADGIVGGWQVAR